MLKPAALFACLAVLSLSAAAAAGRGARITTGVIAVVSVEAGWFQMGSDDEDVAFASRMCEAGEPRAGCNAKMFMDEVPSHSVYLSAYRIDRTEVSNRAYGRCVAANVCTPSRLSETDTRLGNPEHPVGAVSWLQAQRYCRFLGGSLPTEAQWERAARGGSKRRFPWGHYFNGRLANHGLAGLQPGPDDGYRYAAPVHAYADGRSAHGLLNMAGNVWELVADRYAEDYYEHSERIDPRGPRQGDGRAMRGGSWRSPAFSLRVTERENIGEKASKPDVGFRCVH